MRLSIRLRVVIALNAFALCLVLALGWVAQEVAGRVVEERLAKEMVSGVSDFLVKNGFPRSDSMMRYLREIFNSEWVVVEDSSNDIVASSLPDETRGEFSQQMPRIGRSGAVILGGKRYRVDSSDVSIPEGESGEVTPRRLYMLVPYEIFQEARSMALSRVRKVIWIAAGAATVLAILFAISITRPISNLAGEMDRLAKGELVSSGADRPRSFKGPLEVSRLASSFYDLMDRLDVLREQLARNERLATLGKVSLSVAHELRNPLSGIKMNVRVLKDNLGPSSEDDPGVEAILREIDRMELFLNELMNLSPGTQPAPRELDCVNVRLSSLAESVLTILSGRCRHSKITITRDFPDDEPEVCVDPNQLRQAMMNLIVNAIEAMPGGGEMTLRIASSPSAVRFSVTDTGKGVTCPENDIFDAFISGKPNGVGLGLYLCRQILDRHGGTIEYDSSLDGTTFRMEIPRDRPRTNCKNFKEESDQDGDGV